MWEIFQLKDFVIRFSFLFVTFFVSISCLGVKRVGPLQMELVTEQNGIVPGQDFWIGWRIMRDQGWHTYWKYPGDVGVAPSLDWSPSEGISIGELLYCTPEKVKMASIRANGNYGETLFLCKVSVSDQLKAGESITLTAKAAWLTCSRQCLPGFTDLSIKLEVVNSREFDPVWNRKFELFRKSIPQPLPDIWETSVHVKGRFIDLKLQNRNSDQSSDDRPIFFCSNRLISSDGDQLFKKKENLLHLRLERSPWARKDEQFLSGLLFKEKGWGEGTTSQYFTIKVPLVSSK